jgi:hypothetical protein
MLHTPRSCPQWRSTHALLRQFVSLSTTWSWACHIAYLILLDHAHTEDQHITTFVDSILLVYKIMSTSHYILLYHDHIGDQHIIPSFVDSIRLVLRYDKHVTLQTLRSCPHSRSTHLFLCPFVSLSTTRLFARHVANSSIMPTLEINTSFPSSIQFAYY